MRPVNSTVSAGGSPSGEEAKGSLAHQGEEMAYPRSQRCKRNRSPWSDSKVGIFTILIYVQGQGWEEGCFTGQVLPPVRAYSPRIEVMGHPGPWRACGRPGGVKGMILSERALGHCNSFTFLSCDSSEEGQSYYFIM